MSAIIVALDARPCTEGPLSVARALADFEGATLHVVHVGERNPAAHALASRLGIASESLRGSVIHGDAGDAAHTMLALASRERAAAIVLCTLGAGDPAHRSLGACARTVLAEATCPVVLVRPEPLREAWTLEEVLLPHDGSPATTAAIRPAATIASQANAKLLALHVATPGTHPRGEPGALPVPRYVDQPQHEWPAWATEFLERLESSCTLDPARVRLFLGRGEPGAEVLRVANEQRADLVVLAWHGGLDVHHAAVFKKLLRHAPCPMMVLRVDGGAG